jgi:phospholipase C
MNARRVAVVAAPVLVVAVLVAGVFGVTGLMTRTAAATNAADGAYKTTTPIKHLVVIFQENVSFDHYFGTYPNATNPAGEPRFVAAPNTPSVNGLTGALLTTNLNLAHVQRVQPFCSARRIRDAPLTPKMP